jgi:sugar (pentulose or hexulose) kinase
MDVTAVFDIGKTNKKFFLFDENYQEVYKQYRRFEPIEDEDGHPCDNLPAIEAWLKEIFAHIREDKTYQVRAINFSTYGASLVHLDDRGQVIAPLYNYTKPYPEEILVDFYAKYGEEMTLARQTASPSAGMLNAGLQLYWLKQRRPELYARIDCSLHFPQYLSYLFTGIAVSDFTSIGCHTSLWDYEKGDYHAWVYAEGFHRLLPPIVPTDTSINMDYAGKRLTIGVGIHDSSAALLPYLKADHTPFLLISTGTWSISLNPFSQQPLSAGDLRQNCLHYLRIDGQPVRAARLFLGNEYNLQIDALRQHFDKPDGYHREVRFDEQLYREVLGEPTAKFHFESVGEDRVQPPHSQLEAFPDYETAFHQLMWELMSLQHQAAKRAIGQADIGRIYVDGGFADNEIFIRMLSHVFPGCELRSTQSPLGSALGAAMVVSDRALGEQFLETHYAMKKHQPLILS